MRIDLDLPSGLDASEYEVARRAAREAAILRLYADGAISGGSASKELGMGIEAFLLWASKRGVPVLQASVDDLDEDTASALDAAGPDR